MDTAKTETVEPDEPAEDRNPRITFVISRADFDKLDQVARVRRSSVAQLVREIVGAALDAGYANA